MFKRRNLPLLVLALLPALFLAGAGTALAQKPFRECATEPTPEELSRFKARWLTQPYSQVEPLGAAVCVRLQAHVVRRSDGTGGISQAQLDQAIIDANTAYAGAGITFHWLTPIDYIDDDDLYADITTDAEIDALLGINVTPNAINCYFHPDVANEDGGLCGRASFTTSTVQGIIYNNGCVGTADNPSTFPHEIGHYFDLFHTHSTANGAELVDGSNCATAGDLLCDTPADPNLTDVVTDGCVYFGTEVDANGDEYTPDTRQIMSYSVKLCRDTFSPMSLVRAYNTLIVSRSETINCPPTADAGPDQTVECESYTTTAVSLDGTASSDPEGDALTYAWSAPGVTFDDPTSATPTGDFPFGSTVVTLTVTANSAQDTDQITVTVEDTTPPEITCPAAVTIECSDHCEGGGVPNDDAQLADFFAGVSATDVCDSDPVITDDRPACFPLGTTDVIFTATDSEGNAASCTTSVTVEDTTPPEITVLLNRDSLWPPNHKLVPITAEVEVTDICDPNPTFVLTSVTSDEPDNGLGDGDTADDIQGDDLGTDDTELLLRSERAGGGDGRKYTIIYTASDESGNTAQDTVCVVVPHDQRGHAAAAGGFLATGAGVDPNQPVFRVVVVSKPNFDARDIAASGVALGNSVDGYRPLKAEYREASGDGRVDLVLTFDTRQTMELRSLSTKQDPIGLHYWGSDGQGYLVDDIFKLGTPLPEAAVAEGVHGDDGGAEDGSGIELPGQPGTGLGDETGLDPSGALVLGQSGPVTVEIFSVTGRKVRTLVSGDLSAGRHELAWDGRDEGGQSVSSGLYFYRIRTTDGILSKKIHLAR